MNNKQTLFLSLALAFQFSILSGMYVLAALPLWTGKEIKLNTKPVDPRSLFRGNYALLKYDISEIDQQSLPTKNKLRNGEKIYITLIAGENNIYQFSQASLKQPDNGTFLVGRIQNRSWSNASGYYSIKYGIEAFFAPKEKALALEKQLRNNAIAVLMVASNGKARLKDVISAK